MVTELRLMAVHAHPDDESSKGAATTARYAAAGNRVLVVTLTGGELGDILNPAMDLPEVHGRIAEVRRDEMAKAAEILGVEHTWLGYHDSGLPQGDPLPPLPEGCFALEPLDGPTERLVRVIREFRPHVMTTYDENGGYPHPDHIRCHEVSVAAYEAAGDYRIIDGSKGDYGLNVTWGKTWENGNVLASVGWQHRSKLSVADRDWANRSYLSNPEAGWSAAGNPSTFIPLASTTNGMRDPACSSLGGFAGFSGLTPVCYWHYTPFDNLVEKSNAIQAYAEANADLSATTKFHVEVLYAHTDVPEWNTSPSYAALAVPTAEVAPSPALAGRYYVPASNPGLLAFIAAITSCSVLYGDEAATTTAP